MIKCIVLIVCLRSNVRQKSSHVLHQQQNIQLVLYFLLVSPRRTILPLLPQTLHGLVWSWQGVWQRTVKILVAAWSSVESQFTVTDSSRSSCTCHWLSSRLSELGDRRGQAGRSEKCVHVNVCACVRVGGFEVALEGHWLGCQSYMESMCMEKREGE